MPAIAAQMGHDSLRACSFAHPRRNDEIWFRVLGFRHRGIARLPQRCYVIDVDSQAQTAHWLRKLRELIAPNRTQSVTLSKWETKRRSGGAVIAQGRAGGRNLELANSLTISRAWRIRCRLCRLLAAGFCLRLVQCLLGFSIDCFGGFFCFLAYRLSGFLRLSPDSLRCLFGFFSDCLSGFLGFFACSFKAVLNRLPCFFCFVLYVLHWPFLREHNKRRSYGQSNNKARNFHDSLLFHFMSLYIKNG